LFLRDIHTEIDVLAEKYQERIEKIFAKYPDKRSAVMPLLYVAQEEYGYVSPDGISEVAELCQIDPTQVKSIAGFYSMYRESPKGKYWLQVCTDLPCALRGADQFYSDLLAYLEVEDGGTTKDEMFTVEHVTCLAACHRAPMLQCNFHFQENLDMEKMKTLIAGWRTEAENQAKIAATQAASDAAPAKASKTSKSSTSKASTDKASTSKSKTTKPKTPKA
jgi:NADH-quinone oxidoreductase subunit E